MKKVLWIFLVTLMLAGLALYSCKDELVQELTGSILGTVADATTGEPVPTVNVSLEPGGKSALTGSDGNYLFSDLEVGSYTVSISKQGYTPDSRVIEVEPDKSANGDFLIERIPAVVTVDRDTLDFGDGSDVNSLSFNIVNSGYEDLEWKIEYDCDWIKEIRDSSGVLAYGKTQSIVVFIDRDKLVTGKNETVVVVRSSNGSSDLTVLAIGAEREEVVLNTLSVEDITSNSATFYGRIINSGLPKYTARGFVYSTSSKPTEATAIEVLTSPVTEDSVFSSRVSGLELGRRYYVRAFAKSDLGTFYSTNEESFIVQGTDPKVTVLDVSNVNIRELTATFNATVEAVGDPEYTSRGFVYDTIISPTIYNKVLVATGTGAGTYSADVKNLEFDKTYYVRAYVESEAGIFYSDAEVAFNTEGEDPVVSVQEVSGINVAQHTAVFNGTVENAGYPEYAEKGFVYGTLPNPDMSDKCIKVSGTGTGSFSASADELNDDVIYYVRSYVKTVNGKVIYSSEEVSFMLSAVLPVLTAGTVTDISVATMSAVLNGTVSEIGDPPYTEKGFVYGLMPNPTVSDNAQPVAGTGKGDFSTRVSGVESSKEYYVRAYAKVDTLVIYSNNQVSFIIETVAPEVSVQPVGSINLTSRTAVLNGTVLNVGNPPYTEKGFVYSLTNNPTLADVKIAVSGSGSGPYSAVVEDLQLDVTYYVRAYAISNGEVVYSPESVQLSTKSSLPELTVQNVTNINISEGTAIFNGTITSMGNPEYYERGFVFGQISNPTLNDNVVISEGDGLGAYRSEAKGLEMNTQYYVRAYAVSIAGISYSSNEVIFTTEPELPSVSVQTVSNINIANRTAIFNGTVDNVGNPAYSEKGFVYGVKENPTIYDNKVTVEGSGSGLFSIQVSGFVLDQKYYVRSYAINEGGVAYSSTNTSFTISVIPAEISVLPVIGMDYTAQTAVLRGSVQSVGDPSYTEKGFVYSTSNESPSLCENQMAVNGTGLGGFSAEITDVRTDISYYVWAYSVNGGQRYYSNSYEKFTLSPVLPELEIREVSNMDIPSRSVTLNASVIEEGQPIYKERGFVYGKDSNPTVEDSKVIVDGTGTGFYSAEIDNISLNSKYYIRAYAINGNANTITYSDNETSFTMSIVPPTVDILPVTDVNNAGKKAVFNGTVLNAGDPQYTERGFVYGKTTNPLMCDGKIVAAGTGIGNYSASAENLQADIDYNIWAYVTTVEDTYYSDTYTSLFIYEGSPILPKLTTQSPTDVNFETGTAVFVGTVTDEGYPPYTERGFVYSLSNSEPTIYDNRVISFGKGITGTYNASVTDLSKGDVYIRAYAMNDAGVAYGNTIMITSKYKELPTLGLMVQSENTGIGTWDAVNSICENSKLGGFSDWRLPTLSELQSMYSIKDYIGGFDGRYDRYWSTDYTIKDYTDYQNVKEYYTVDFEDGEVRSISVNVPGLDPTENGRCVRTLR